MKKARLFTLFAIMVISTVLLLVGCQENDNISTVSLKGYDPNTPIEVAVGEFDCDAYTVVLTYDSQKTEEIPLTEEMIAETDLFKLYQEGEHNITASYDKYEFTFKLSVKRASFGELTFSENNVFTYDGEVHSVEVEGNIPANAVVTYVGGNSFVNAGTYDVVAIVSCEGYVTQKVSTTVKIERAKYDMSGVKFEPKEFVYDGVSHSVEISGVLPEGVAEPTYVINEKITSSATDVGEYKVVAKFTNNDQNYEPIPDMETVLKITPAEYTVSGVDIVFKRVDGQIIEGRTKVYDASDIYFDLNDYSKLSKKVSVAFSVYDKDGKLISSSNKKPNIINAGTYTVKAEFTLAGGENYKPIEPLVCTFEVTKLTYSIGNVTMNSDFCTFDGDSHSLRIDGELPNDVTVSYEYYIGQTLIVDADGKPVQSVVDAGRYTVKAVFTHANENYGYTSDLTATLNIEKVKIDISLFGFSNINNYEYSGQPYDPLKSSNVTEYSLWNYSNVKYYVLNENGEYVAMGENELPTEVGSYMFTVTVSILDSFKKNYALMNGEMSQEYSVSFQIRQRSVALPSVTFNSESETVYTGSPYSIVFDCDADTSLMNVGAAYYKYDSGKYVAMNAGAVPTNAGLYRLVVTVSIDDPSRYAFSNGDTSEEFTFDFEIKTQRINVSVIELDHTTATFDGNNHLPIQFKNVPDHVNVTVTAYTSVGTTPVDRMINAGMYRIEVGVVAESSNYVLSTRETLVFYFEILPLEIDVSGLTFDAVEFVYSGQRQQPILKDIPQHVKATKKLYWGDDTKNNSEEYNGKLLAVDAGKYGCRVTLTAENSNYTLVGTTTYTTSFNINRKEIDVTDRLANVIELPYIEAGYDSETLRAMLVEGISEHVECQMNSYKIKTQDGEWKYTPTMKEAGSYKVEILIRVKDDNYALLNNGNKFATVVLFIYYNVVAPQTDSV